MSAHATDAHATGATRLARAITAHLAALEASGYAASTVANRRLHLAQFSAWCDARGLTALAELTPGILERYRQWLAGLRQSGDRSLGQPLGWTTQASKLTAVRMLLAWATRTKHLMVNPAADMALPRLPKRLPRAVLSVSEAERVLAQPDLTTALGLRDRAILEVLYSTGSVAWSSSGSTSPMSAPSARSCSCARERGRKIAWCQSARARSRGSTATSTPCGRDSSVHVTPAHSS